MKSDALSEDATALYQGLSCAQDLLGLLRESVDPDVAMQLAELGDTLDGLSAESERLRAKLHERETTQKLPIGELILAFRNELLTSVVAIEGHVDLVLNSLRDPLTPTQTQFLEAVIQNVECAVKMLHNFADVVRISEGKLEIALERLALRDVVDVVVGTTAEQVASHKHTLAVEMPGDLPPAHGNMWRLTQAVSELVINACNYTPDGGQITVGAHAADGKVHLTVKDTGVGISVPNIERLGEPFFRSVSKSVRQHPGAGLGYFMALNIVRIMGGDIVVESEVGAGTAVTIVLPAAGA